VPQKRKHYRAEFKFKTALAAAKGDRTLAEVASEAGVHPSLVRRWTQQLLDGGATIFQRRAQCSQHEFEEKEAGLRERIRRLQLELDWLKQKLPHTD
jgi:putative transposase